MGKYIVKIILKAINIGILIGFVTGLALSIINITAHSYFEYKLYNLILFDLNHNLTKYTIISVICAIIALAAVLIIIQAYRYLIHNRKGSHKTFGFLSEIIGSKLSSGIGACALALVIILNIFTFIYTRAQTGEGPNIVLISIDTLRADHLGSYGYERNTSPNIDKLAEKGVLFENAYSQSPWTIPSVASIFTSLYPIEHGATNQTNKLPDKMTTLSEYMKNNLYTTAAIVSNRLLKEKHGFSQGFDQYDEETIRKKINSDIVSNKAIKFLSENNTNKFFLWVHYYDPHAGYIRHPQYGYASDYTGIVEEDYANFKFFQQTKDILTEYDIQHIKDIYDEEISFTDEHIGKLLRALEKLDLAKNTIIVLTADHGEEFKERKNIGHHGGTVYDELIRVPLIIYSPFEEELKGHRVRNVVETRSIPTTVLDISGIPNSTFGGQNLMHIAKLKETHNGYVAFSEGSTFKGDGNTTHGIIRDQWKLVKNLDDQTFELYDLENDPEEKNNLFESQDLEINKLRRNLISELDVFKKERLQGLEKAEFSEEEVKQLKALGYMQ
jgi:arylsulfatase A-like enzyme